MFFSRIFQFCTSSSSGFSYVTSSHMYMKSFVNVCDVESADNRYVCQIVNCIFVLNTTRILSHQALGSLMVRKKEFGLKRFISYRRALSP